MPNLRKNQENLNQTPDAQGQIRAMGDSEWLIRKVVAEGVRSEETYNTIDRNASHLEYMLTKEHIQNAGQDLTSLQEAAALGREFMSVPLE